eukprot:5604472-Amphidinium_carterae.1
MIDRATGENLGSPSCETGPDTLHVECRCGSRILQGTPIHTVIIHPMEPSLVIACQGSVGQQEADQSFGLDALPDLCGAQLQLCIA